MNWLVPFDSDSQTVRGLRLQTLVRLRWMAVVGQTGAVLWVHFVLGFSVPLGPCLAVIAISAWLNVFLWLGPLRIFTAVAGVVALTLAAINIKDYFVSGVGPTLSIPEGAKPGLFKNRHLARLREVADDITRQVESLDAARERAAVVQDELMNRMSEQINKNMYVLSVIAGVFLPLGFVTGLLGVNVDGIPGDETPWAFAALCGLMLALVLFEVWLFRRFKWI